jgi:O-methyltransferase
MQKSNLNYTPSFMGKIARVVIPILQKSLPEKIYKLIYNFLYNLYKTLLRWSYVFKFCFYNLFGNRKQKLKVNLTHKLLNYTMGGRKALENAFDVVDLVESNNIAGALVECGVAEGGTAAMLALANKNLGNNIRNKWFFDSYEGLPEPTREDYELGKTGHFIRPLPKGSCLGTIEQVSELMFTKLKFTKNEVNLIKGWFQDTVPVIKNKIGPIAILRLDGDWYESTKVPLENFYDQITEGGYIIIDDYLTCFGSRKAVDEYLSNNNIQTQINLDGRGGVWFMKPITSK